MCAAALTGCRLDLVVEASVDEGGGGTVGLAAGFDEALLEELDALGVDPTAELEATVATTGWEVERRADGEGGLEVEARRAVADAAGIGTVLRDLTAGLGDTDPALLVDLDVTLQDDGGVEVTGTAAFRPPTTAGFSIDGVPQGPSAAELAAIAAWGVDARLQLELPGEVTMHDGDRIEGRTVVWDLPVGDEVQVRASAAPVDWWRRFTPRWDGASVIVLAGVAAVAVLVAGTLGLWWRRLRRSG